ncbi:MAG: copper uptake system-associated protein [Rheinheimera sp.]|nr:copper uptake system-associated protein [Rheinheimera sp.]
MRKIGNFFAIVMVAMWLLAAPAHSEGLSPQPANQTANQTANQAAAQSLITEQLQTLWPNTRVGAISVAGNYALADWWLSDKAGRALLQKDATSGHWLVILCGGDALLDATFLTEVGVEQATTLTKNHLVAEATLSAAEKTALGSMLKPMRLNQEHGQHKAH